MPVCATSDNAEHSYGCLQLARGVYHVGFLTKVKKILESICLNCGKLKADPYVYLVCKYEHVKT